MRPNKIYGIMLDSKLVLVIPPDLGVLTVFQCERGFWWGENDTSRVTSRVRNNSWIPQRVLLHKNQNNTRIPFRTALAKNWQKKVYRTQYIIITNEEDVIYISNN